jgi:alpha-tubulin suppressor-like RCC1 family protein
MALKQDGSIVTWGSYLYGGDSSAASSYLNGVSTIAKYSTVGFSAINSNGELVSWTNYQYLPNFILKETPKLERIISNKSLQHGYAASAAIAEDGSVFAWGDRLGGGSIYENICELDGRYNSCLH